MLLQAQSVVATKTLGGTGSNQALATAIDPQGNVYVAGITTSVDFRTGISQLNVLVPSDLAPGSAILSTSYFFTTIYISQ